MNENKSLTKSQPETLVSDGLPFTPTRGQLVRALLVFQLRLLLDGFRDLLLSPVSFIATLLDLLGPDSRRGQYFEMLCYWGQKSDRWIDLFGLAKRDANADDSSENTTTQGIERLLESVEAAMRDGTMRQEKQAALKSRVQKLLRDYLV